TPTASVESPAGSACRGPNTWQRLAAHYLNEQILMFHVKHQAPRFRARQGCERASGTGGCGTHEVWVHGIYLCRLANWAPPASERSVRMRASRAGGSSALEPSG